jgi:hypothetical protein
MYQKAFAGMIMMFGFSGGEHRQRATNCQQSRQTNDHARQMTSVHTFTQKCLQT